MAITVEDDGAGFREHLNSTARVCLPSHDARFVGRRGDGGGYAIFKTGSTFWTYKTFLGQVSSVTVYFAGRPGLTSAKKRAVRACVSKGI